MSGFDRAVSCPCVLHSDRNIAADMVCQQPALVHEGPPSALLSLPLFSSFFPSSLLLSLPLISFPFLASPFLPFLAFPLISSPSSFFPSLPLHSSPFFFFPYPSLHHNCVTCTCNHLHFTPLHCATSFITGNRRGR